VCCHHMAPWPRLSASLPSCPAWYDGAEAGRGHGLSQTRSSGSSIGPWKKIKHAATTRKGRAAAFCVVDSRPFYFRIASKSTTVLSGTSEHFGIRVTRELAALTVEPKLTLLNTRLVFDSRAASV
jgi:hypothetical protein